MFPNFVPGLLYMGVPVAQSMFAGASLITTYLLSAPANKSLMSPSTLDEAARYILITILQYLNSLSDGKVITSVTLSNVTLQFRPRSSKHRTVVKVKVDTCLSLFVNYDIFQESRISDNFPGLCINSTMVEAAIEANGCRGDFLSESLAPGVGIIANSTMCREGSLPDIVQKIARQLVTVVGDC